MMCCDLCGTTAECVQKKEIEGREFAVCECCWHPLEEKLSGKGRVEEILEQLEGMKEYEEVVY